MFPIQKKFWKSATYMTVHPHNLIQNNRGHVATALLLLISKKFWFKIMITAEYFPNYW
jgi:hypothetical protein